MKIPVQSQSIKTEFEVKQFNQMFSTLTFTGIRPLGGGGGGGTNPPLGCWPSGYECRGWIQNKVYCCPGGTTWKKREGWCIGWFDAPPCI